MGVPHYSISFLRPPIKASDPYGAPHPTMKPPTDKGTSPIPLKNEVSYQDIIPKKKSKNCELSVISVSLIK